MGSDGERPRLSVAADAATVLFVLLASGVFIATLLPGERGEENVRQISSTIDIVEDFAVRGPDGAQPAPLPPMGTGPSMILVFRTDCSYCATQKRGWFEISDAARRAGLPVVAITSEPYTSDVASYFQPNAREIKVLSIDPIELMPKLGTSAVPTTILLDANRRPVLHRVGLLEDSEIDRVLERIAMLANTGE